MSFNPKGSIDFSISNSNWTEGSTIREQSRSSYLKIGQARSARPISNYEHDDQSCLHIMTLYSYGHFH